MYLKDCRSMDSVPGWTTRNSAGMKYPCLDGPSQKVSSQHKTKLGTIDTVLDECKDVKDALSLLGTVGFYRQLMPMVSDIEAPLYDLTKMGCGKKVRGHRYIQRVSGCSNIVWNEKLNSPFRG